MVPKTITALFKRLQSRNPHPTTELHYHTPFELLIAVILSAQATDASVNKATGPLFKVACTPEAILQLGSHRLKQYIQTIGLYNNKAKHILSLCQILIERHQGQVPPDRAALEALPGVGRKTANVILNTVFGQDTLAVDTHILRVSHRIGLANAKTPLAVEKQLLACIPKPYLKYAHHWLILHGRYTCVARKPKCYSCCIYDLCQYADKDHYAKKG